MSARNVEFWPNNPQPIQTVFCIVFMFSQFSHTDLESLHTPLHTFLIHGAPLFDFAAPEILTSLKVGVGGFQVRWAKFSEKYLLCYLMAVESCCQKSKIFNVNKFRSNWPTSEVFRPDDQESRQENFSDVRLNWNNL